MIEDDGNEYEFTLSGGNYAAPPGRFDQMVRDTGLDKYIVTAPDQSVRVFEPVSGSSAYRLATITDSSGNTLAVVYHSDPEGPLDKKIHYVKSAADGLASVGDHRLTFAYDAGNSYRLETITDVIGRVWHFNYDTPTPPTTPRVVKIDYPTTATGRDSITASAVEITAYDSSGRILSIKDRETHVWSLTYASGRVATATDPIAATGQTPFVQSISYPSVKMEGYWRTTVTDRRGKNWQFDFDDDANLRRTADPLGLAATPKYYQTYTYDANHNVLTATDEYSKTWTATYGAVGNLLTLTGPPIASSGGLQQIWTLAWEQPDPPARPNFWRMTQVTDPASHWVQYGYTDTNDATLVTTVTEMPDGVPGSLSNANAVTTIEYYDSGLPSARGQVYRVTDANGVLHNYEYDQWGYFKMLTEGLVQPIGPNEDVFPCEMGPYSNDAAGGVQTGTGDTGASSTTCMSVDDGSTCDNCVLPIGDIKPKRLGNLPSPQIQAWSQCLTTATYNKRRQQLTAIGCKDDLLVVPAGSSGFETERAHTWQYDNLGRMTSNSVQSRLGATPTLMREFAYGYLKPDGSKEAAGVTEITGPDGKVTKYTYDELGRVATSTCDDASSNGTKAVVIYDRAGRTTQIDYGFSPNGSRTAYVYDEVGRVTQIKHQTLAGTVRYQIDYSWNLNNTVASRSETDNFALTTAYVAFEYDARDRLIGETREENVGTGLQTVYDMTYRYDQLGNRKEKFDAATASSPAYYTAYTYDIDFPDPMVLQHPTRNNRLLWYTVQKDSSGGPLLRTVSYTYYKSGAASNITVKDNYVDAATTPGNSADYAWHNDLALYYFTNGSLRLAMNDRWHVGTEGGFFDYAPTTAREFRYDSPRARYLQQDYQTNGSTTFSNWTRVGDLQLTDYDGVSPWGDSNVEWSSGTSSFSAAPSKRYQDAYAEQSINGEGQVSATLYLHGDLVESNVMTSDPNGAALATTAYTAFGERVGGNAADPSELGTRYQYAGAYGYEAGMLSVAGPNTDLPPVTLSHVGARWYQAGIGRFVQRDPIGLNGGTNVYVYLADNPCAMTDPEGLAPPIFPPGWGPPRWLPPLGPGWRWTNWPPGSGKWVPARALPVIQPTSRLARFLRFVGPLGRLLPVVGAAIIINGCVSTTYAAQPSVNNGLSDAAEDLWNGRIKLSQRGVQGGGIRSGGTGVIQ